MRKLIKFILSQLENIFNSTARFKKVLNPDNPNEGFGDITEIFGEQEINGYYPFYI